MFAPTPVETMTFAQREIFVKRDDLIHPDFSGNKARKFQYFLEKEYPEITKLVGYGSAQANSLHSLAVLAKMRGWQLDYYVDHIANYLQQNPQGNYLAALENGANIIEKPEHVTESIDSYVTELAKSALDNELYIPEGGRCEYAAIGLEQLGQQILDWIHEKHYSTLNLFLPSGTGTTALFLQRFFKIKRFEHEDLPEVNVLTCSCVGGDDYLRLQFNQLSENALHHPRIISNGNKYHFGKLKRECYEMWQRVCASGIEFELLYDPVGFIMLEHFFTQSSTVDNIDNTAPLMYLHQGGVLGNPSMLARYQRKYQAK
ncbi:1-aminocyclopropane-1-carboxylate deaminase/D-cysteine desulfhydrase [Shewanella electrodiphila]|uniref:1-aminocyclopropane-1-carboxylate deaminase/D-cysteine desulfhydrase n=1 Tax=Shewanella electrodiphila TaxID=934143 RepID=A0ABT0KPT4_9GAMM|nr:1-aminocyclopropane-1-carboxylate deaminase/D-cysteine desulfhydrase [Shewanella electrodiphila]MCL1045850.1 1-aminocyclopropane-1-carboxylate deaminase/D-cysteine desulfhydrase [Shewanella electrodiphila]